MRKRGSPRTLTDVARLAHVGVATVSRVVNGGEHVSPETRRRVEAAIAKLGYLPNHAARILKGGRTKIVGLLVPSIADSFFASCAEAAGEIARNHDSLLVVAPSSDNQEPGACQPANIDAPSPGRFAHCALRCKQQGTKYVCRETALFLSWRLIVPSWAVAVQVC